jgi:hypothetical protein
MADETAAAAEQTTETTEHQETVKQTQTLQSIVDEVKASHDKKAEVPEATEEPDKQPVKHKQTANERISDLVKERNAERDKAAAIEGKFDALSGELATIKAMLESGKITQAKAQEMKEDVQEKLDDLEIPEELQPYQDVIQKMIDRGVQAKIAPIQAAEAKRQQEAEAKNLSEFRKSVTDNYNAVASEYADMFTGETGKDGMPVWKPEYEAKAEEVLKLFEFPADDKGNIYNPLLASKQGIEMLMRYVSKPIAEAKQAKQEIDRTKEAVEKARRSRVETPTATPTVPAKPKSLLDIVEQTKKELGG